MVGDIAFGEVWLIVDSTPFVKKEVACTDIQFSTLSLNMSTYLLVYLSNELDFLSCTRSRRVRVFSLYAVEASMLMSENVEFQRNTIESLAVPMKTGDLIPLPHISDSLSIT
jgi:hypothetical protein